MPIKGIPSTIWINLHELAIQGQPIMVHTEEPMDFLCDGSIPNFHFVKFSLIARRNTMKEASGRSKRGNKAVKRKSQQKKKAF